MAYREKGDNMLHRFYIVSEKHGLMGVRDTQEDAEEFAIRLAVCSGTVYVHDRLTEL